MRFFLGSNTPSGFASHFQSAYNTKDGWRVWIIKGGAGTGKSGMMKKIAAEADKITGIQRIYCSSDPDSLDAVILPEKKKMILDGTAPHVVEPKLVGACENILNVGAFWDSDYLYSRADEISELSAECSRCHARASRYINAACTFNRDSRRMIEPHFDTARAVSAADALSDREFGAPSDKSGVISVRLLSAVTPKGTVFFEDSISEKCDRIIGIIDKYGVASAVLERIEERAAASGYNITVCPCSVNTERTEHIIIPELKLAFTTVNRYHGAKCTETVEADEFIDSKAFERCREKLRFNSAAADGLFEEASAAMAEAKKIHDKLEAIYIESMDFEPINELTEKMIEIMIR